MSTTRRTIIVGSALAIAAAASASSQPALAQARPRLKTTPNQVLGPYFLPNSPLNKNLVIPGETGTVIKIAGRVLDVYGTALSAATVHVWLADPHGHYDNQDEHGDAHPIPPADQKLRGRIITDASGNYDFTALRPGNYPLENGQRRPAHIHVIVEAAGFKRLVTQLYFTDEPLNQHDLPGDGFFKPELLVPMQADAAGVLVGNFDFVLT